MRRRAVHAILVAGCVSLLAAMPAQGFIISSVDPDPWLSTASGPRLGNGDPATITWSIVPDGTSTVKQTGSGRTPSNLIATLNIQFGGNPAQPDLTQQPWFEHLEASFDRWSALGGVTFVYESHDDGVLHPSSNGVLGVRGDIRISGFNIDGAGGTLAFAYLPTSGSDMAFDTEDWAFFGQSAGDFVRLRNTLMHEIGHAFGVLHVNSSSQLLMEPVIDTSFDGPQLDEVRAVQLFFGDANEKANNGLGNDTAAQATPLGTIAAGGTVSIGEDANVPGQAISANVTDFVSISNNTDVDFYRFSVSQSSLLDAALTPRGGVFFQASDGETQTSFNADARSNLALTLLAANGTTILATADTNPAGVIESLNNFLLPTAGTYYAAITGADDTIQLYELSLAIAALLPGDLDADGFVGQDDLNIILGAWGDNVTAGDRMLGDPSGDGFVGQNDLNVVLGNWGQGVPSIVVASATVPEPQAFWLAVVAVAGWTGFRRAGVGIGASINCSGKLIAWEAPVPGA